MSFWLKPIWTFNHIQATSPQSETSSQSSLSQQLDFLRYFASPTGQAFPIPALKDLQILVSECVWLQQVSLLCYGPVFQFILLKDFTTISKDNQCCGQVDKGRGIWSDEV